jgi:hypothetical protein
MRDESRLRMSQAGGSGCSSGTNGRGLAAQRARVVSAAAKCLLRHRVRESPNGDAIQARPAPVVACDARDEPKVAANRRSRAIADATPSRRPGDGGIARARLVNFGGGRALLTLKSAFDSRRIRAPVMQVAGAEMRSPAIRRLGPPSSRWCFAGRGAPLGGGCRRRRSN